MLTKARLTRKRRGADKVRGTAEYPRLVVHRSNKYVYAQIIDDVRAKVLVSVNEKTLASAKGTKMENAAAVGKEIADLAKKAKISKVKFDRSGYLYHGRVKALADGAREAGLQI